MILKPSQVKLYWGRIRRSHQLMLDLGARLSLDLAAFRAEIHADASIPGKSLTQFSQRDLDAVFRVLDAIDIFAGPLTKGDRRRDQPRLRTLYVIEHLGMDDAYIAHVARDRFATADWRNLDIFSLRQLLWTIKSRAKLHR